MAFQFGQAHWLGKAQSYSSSTVLNQLERIVLGTETAQPNYHINNPVSQSGQLAWTTSVASESSCKRSNNVNLSNSFHQLVITRLSHWRALNQQSDKPNFTQAQTWSNGFNGKNKHFVCDRHNPDDVTNTINTQTDKHKFQLTGNLASLPSFEIHQTFSTRVCTTCCISLSHNFFLPASVILKGGHALLN